MSKEIPAKRKKRKKDPNSPWKDLNESQSMKTIVSEQTKETVFVIAPKDYEQSMVPLFCPLCEFPMIRKEDITEYKLHNLCYKCSCRWQGKNLKKVVLTEEFHLYLYEREELEKPQLNLK